MKSNPVGWFEIYVKDMPRARKFYETVLDGKLEKLELGELEYWMFPMDSTAIGAGGALARMEGFTPNGNSTLVYFTCDDCAVEGSRVVPAGGRIVKEKFSIGEFGFIVLAYDTEDNMIGLHSRK